MDADALILLRERLCRATANKRDGETVTLAVGDVRTIADLIEDVVDGDEE